MRTSKFILSILCITCSLSSFAREAVTKSPSNVTKYHAPLSFIENKGQVTDQFGGIRSDIQFKLPAKPGLNVFIGAGDIHYQYSNTDNSKNRNIANDMYRMDMTLLGANKNAQPITEVPNLYTENYVQNGAITAHTYNKITYKDIYPNIDWVLYISNGHLEHEFIVHEGADPSLIQIAYNGASELKMNSDGSFSAITPKGTITEAAPKTYIAANKNEIKSKFILENNLLAYSVSPNKSEFIIDPAIDWGTYFGGTADDAANSMAVDASGNIYMNGTTASAANIATTGAYQASIAGSQNAFLAKFNSAGTLIWATYYGGTGYTISQGVTTDRTGNIYISGATTSPSGIATAFAHQTSNAGGSFYGDAFLAKFSDTGSLVWATYYGGLNDDNGTSVTTDTSGNVYMTGFTLSNTGIATHGAFDTAFNGGTAYGDAFIAKFNDTGLLVWATYYGGSNDDYANGIVADKLGNIYLAGGTASDTGISTAGAYQVSRSDSTDAFIVKFTDAGTRVWGSYYGGSSLDAANGLTLDAAANVYFSGYTYSDTGIASTGAYQAANAGNGDAFVAKFSSTGSRRWGTYYGGPAKDAGNAICYNNSGYVFVGGSTLSTTGISTTGAYQDTMAGGTIYGDAFYGQFDTLGAMHYGTYYGGAADDVCMGIGTYTSGAVYLAGYTSSTSGIATATAYQTSNLGGNDAFLADFCTLPVIAPITGNSLFCGLTTDTLHDAVNGGVWTLTNSNATNRDSVLTGVSGGTDTVLYTLSNVCGSIAVTMVLTVVPAPNVDSVTGQRLCRDSVTTAVYFTGSVTGTVFTWVNSDTLIGLPHTDTGSIASFTVINNGTSNAIATITVTPAANGCTGPKEIFTITVMPRANAGNISGPIIACAGFTTTLTDHITGGTWTVSNSNASIVSSYIVSGYQYGIINGNTVGGSDSIFYTVTTACGVAVVDTVVTVYALPTVGPIAGTTTVCQGSSITLTDPSTGGWWHSAYTNATVTSGIVTGLGGGIDTIYYTISSDGCGDTTATYLINISPLPANGPINGEITVCAGDTLQLTDGTTGGTWAASNSNGSVSAGIFQGISFGTDSVYYILTNSCGSDTSALAITINPTPAPAIVQTDSTLSATSSYSSYQWYFNGSPITGATGPSYYATDTGEYYLLVTNSNGCPGISTTLDVSNLSVASLAYANAISIFPNPAQSALFIQSPVSVNIELATIDGRILVKQNNATVIALNNLPDGIYLVSIIDPASGLKIKTIRVVKTEE